LGRRLGKPQSCSGRGGEEKECYHCLRPEMNPGHAGRSLVSILT